MSDEETKHEKAWQLVATRSDLISEIKNRGYFVVKSQDLKKWGEREPRLMAKLDSLSDRPKVFKHHNLNILPLNRGTYVIFEDANNSCYFELSDSYNKSKVTEFKPKSDLSPLDTLTKCLCSSESEAIDLAFHSSLLSSFCETEDLLLTRRGRFGSGFFKVKLPNLAEEAQIQNAQIEVDSVFESIHTVVLIEAKIGFRRDFHIRQLHYPYMWLRSQTNKPIKVLLLCYSNGEFQLSEFALGEEFGEIKLKKQEYFVINEPAVTPVRLDHIIRFLPPAEEAEALPFPQADDLDKVVDTVRAIHNGQWRTEDLMSIFGYVERQAGYYTNAARYLGFLVAKGPPELTRTGYRLINEQSRINRTEIVLKGILTRPALRQAVLMLRQYNNDVATLRDDLKALIASYRPDITGDTINRRASTVQNWLKWLVKNCDFGS